jgi:hypothetical protein
MTFICRATQQDISYTAGLRQLNQRITYPCWGPSWRPHGLRRGPTAARLLGLRVRIPPKSLMSVSCEYCVLSFRGLWVGLITCPEESYRVRCVWVWSWSLDNEEALAQQGCRAMKEMYPD